MDQKPTRTQAEISALQEEAIRRALEISELEVHDDFDSKFLLSILFFAMPSLDKAAKTRDRKNTRIEHFRQWLKDNNITPRDCGIGKNFVDQYIPEYSFLY
ncbi:hypothetical protein A3I99_00270 [Candidatus Kaiserbacteria bacterium RIFCSPLOWO2_02_FULL_45_11b]|uniref:Uncharacterized protein n=1 Tax=Candidatus Kaiserbacteria bacterium RIFCSPLOWO2_12_FULL_45_26 TaxID=1798525 RepID=A0A1F6FGD6_9BACT|nr:MAG: hypothetical protein A2Z56_03640 [Candidatus Kaiserbacteria bacterium RIFCSPHIGHO2_12_45_16]OGG71001.1 MAG: hypothetical protein A2929_01570 [Candidatus Kaiserbacteria bacterium RIFCSPLOWO2_01_FULL_45_25]OGG84220.1 MAG: hypothetical protein A3I99_00270 [Candidatus Kaiserbacteria bacterium RIFCSPLOWO2_02_FULL_45_11b]OGG84927.1 MAG: hypothetical protein A3G90_02560 [Candidatus Kaiserbacteria bacterium RIFCSPLOWO2_12_FULL_45_26]